MEINETTQYEDGISRWAGLAHNQEWTLLCGNAVEALGHLEAESIDCIVTSPAYYSLRDYGVDGQIGLEDTISEYVNSLCTVTTELYRVLERDGLLFLNL